MTQTEIRFDVVMGEARKEAGIALASEERGDLLEAAQLTAYALCLTKGTVTYDDVFLAMQARGLHPERLGNAAGSVFRGKQWRFTSRWEKSARVSNHARVNRVWELAND